MISCGVLLELLTNMLILSLLAYIAVKRMPVSIKLCRFKSQFCFISIGLTRRLGGSLSP